MPSADELKSLKYTEEQICGEFDLDGMVDAKGVQFIGKAKILPNGKWSCLANVGGASAG